MLDQLFGNKSIEKILFFLLINGKCYAGKLSRHFKSPLTPIQQALAKLEDIGILESFSEGKIRYFQFNPMCPFLAELEALLRRSYTLLPAAEKKEYYDPEIKPKKTKAVKHSRNSGGLVINVWNKLTNIKNLSFSANSQGQGSSGWNGIGKGKVQVRRHNDNTIVFDENGSWMSREGNEFTFTNVFRWTLDRFQNLVTLEHLRFGENNPVFLFHLTQIDEETLESVSSYICKEDTYLGQVRCDDYSIKFNWRIIGPKKNEEIEYIYQ